MIQCLEYFKKSYDAKQTDMTNKQKLLHSFISLIDINVMHFYTTNGCDL